MPTWWGVWPRWQSRRTWNTPSLANTSKIHLYVEQFSQITSWKLADLIYNKNCKKDLHFTRRKRKKKDIRLELAPVGGIWKEERRSTWVNPCHGYPLAFGETHWECVCAGLLTIRAEKDLCLWVPPCCTSHPKEPTPQPSMRSVQRFCLAMWTDQGFLFLAMSNYRDHSQWIPRGRHC